MSASELGEHAGYLGDGQKLNAYERALSSLIGDGRTVVLDLGAGSGILGLLAARAGARRVYAIDSGAIIGPAREVAALNGFDEVIHGLRVVSTELELADMVDIAVCDQIGGFVHDAGILHYFADVRARLLAPEGVLVPAGFELFVAPAQCDSVRKQLDLWRAEPVGMDFGPFAELAVNTEHRIDAEDVRLLGPGVSIATIPSDHIGPIRGAGDVVIDQVGCCDGFVGWFVADLGGGATLTNRPDAADRMKRWCTFYPLNTGIDVVSSDTVSIDVDIRPLIHAVTWTTSIAAGSTGESTTSERHSTLLGEFLSSEDLQRSSGLPIKASAKGQALSRALALADGTLSTEEVLRVVKDEMPAAVSSPADEQSLRGILSSYTTLPPTIAP